MNRIKLIFAAFMAVMFASAQNQTSPYSMYGYGIIGDRATSMQRQMGSIGYAMNSGRQINVMNPASYAAIDSLTFLFDLGADISFLKSTENGKSQNSIGGGVDYLTMQFPIGKHMGGSFGLLPYSSVGYAFGNEIKHGTMSNQGSGGINQLYLGWAGELKGVSLGFNLSYDFGNIVDDLFTTTQSGGQAKYEHVMQIRDWNINIGAQYTARWDRFHKVVVGLTYSPKKTMLGNTWVTAQEMVQDKRPDTLAYVKMKNRYYSPNSIGAGLNYTFEKSYRLMVEGDFTWQQWSKAPYSAIYDERVLAGQKPTDVKNILTPGMKFYDRTRYAVGAEFVPEIRGSYLKRVAYRIGAYYCNDYLNINGNRLKETAVTCGFGFPTYEGKTLINLGFEWKRRSAHPAKLITENYFNITLGINFNEVWFWQRKIR
ncbi:MAG: hypothetical protein K2K81_11665 [Muribaculaceae bacterium]|nr:hypothetical protein [Muribaculaceae bacterium]